MNKLENDFLIIETSKSGAELTRIFSKAQNKEILWNGDSKYWGRHSPILFPIVGRLKDNETIIDNKVYNMTQHGFARDMNFNLVDTADNSISYKLTSNEDTKKYYPYSFELIITYKLINNNVNIYWEVKNTDSKDIYFSIGAHPAFNIQSNVEDYYLKFNSRNNIENISLKGPFNDKYTKVDTLDRLDLSNDVFKNDAIIYTNIDEISLKSKKEDYFINVSFKDFPLVGIWSPYYKDTNTIAPFICIEPWYGLCDNINSDKIFKNKAFINKLKSQDTFNASYSISIEKK